MNLPNKLTLGRLVLTCAFLIAFFAPIGLGKTLALLLFIVASVTDAIDGYLARRHQLITNFGILMDPLVDKILICSAFIAFVELRLMPAWMVILIVTRELAITGLRLLAASRQVVLAAESLGKHKTTYQIVAIISVLLLVSHPEWGRWAERLFQLPLFGMPWILMFTRTAIWVAVVFTVWSGGSYLWRNRRIYLDDL